MVTKQATLQAWVENDVTIRAVQGEVDCRELFLCLMDETKPVDLSRREVRAFLVKPDGAKLYHDCDIVGEGEAMLFLTSQVTAAPGRVLCEVHVT